MRCPACGHQNEPGANFCSRCGGAVSAVEAESTAMFHAIEPEGDEETHLKELEPGQACLIVRRGPSAGTKFVLDKALVAVGRHPQSDIFLNDITVSRRHAEIRLENDSYVVTDLGSLNGTYVNRERVDRSELGSGDEVQIGKFRLLFLANVE
ncbi:MAG TPA: FHA domain-containing protein [Actinomycetota bacterium]|nr:FHA domain-containing protein [Actinomycetota bacterium]